MKPIHTLTTEWKRSPRPVKIASILATPPLLWWITATLAGIPYNTRAFVCLTLVATSLIASTIGLIQSHLKYRRDKRKILEEQARWATLAEEYRATQTNHNDKIKRDGSP